MKEVQPGIEGRVTTANADQVGAHDGAAVETKLQQCQKYLGRRFERQATVRVVACTAGTFCANDWVPVWANAPGDGAYSAFPEIRGANKQ